jgi:hypothetical protein
MNHTSVCVQCGKSSQNGKTHDHNKSVFCSLETTDWNKLKLIRHSKKK